MAINEQGRDDPEATLRPQDEAPEAPRRLPVEDWDRFQLTRFLGEGGMGQVWEARDPRLDRRVAVKLLNERGPRNLARFVREARFQANLNHPHVCKVHEAGTVEGQAYIAMQRIDGVDLVRATADMTLEQKLALFQQLAEGLHAAHRAGLIHRDVKPGNVLVEGLDRGAPHAYLLDFGLARDLGDTTLTRTGELMGTPAYMAPEQARGEPNQLDRRTDVYGLGATLYRILAGQPPVAGTTSLASLNQAARGEIGPLRQLAPAIPRDVETIVMKCLAGEPAARYDSARAFGDDLARFLNDEPISARPASLAERLVKKARKHKALTAMGAVAALLLALALGWGVSVRRQAAVREAAIAEYTSQVEKIEALTRYMHLAPPHDLTKNRTLIRARMAAIEADMARVGAHSEGPGQYALGRGFMALDEPAAALTHLERAWAEGFREPRAAQALSRTLGALYQQGLVETERIRDDGLRAQRRREIESRYRDPALAFARLGQAAETEAPDFAEALIAFYEGDYSRAETLLRDSAPPPWHYENHQLAGDIAMARAGAAAYREPDRAAEGFDQARAAYRQALAIGRSDPNLRLALAQVAYSHLEMALYRGEALEPFFERGLAAIEETLILIPDWEEALLLQAGLFRRYGENLRNQRSEEARAWLNRSVAASEAALGRDPRSSRAHHSLARAWSQLAQMDKEQDQDPRPALAHALAAFDAVADSDRDFNYFNNLGVAHKTAADYLERRGEDPTSHRTREIEAYDRATALNPDSPNPLINKGSALLALAEASPDSTSSLEASAAALEAALSLAPLHIAAHFYLGRALTELAQAKNRRGMNFEGDLTRALDFYRQGSRLAPKLPHFPNGLGGALLARAHIGWERGEAPDTHLQAAVESFTRSTEIAPKHGYAFVNLGEAHATQAAYRLFRGDDPTSDLDRATAALDQALALMPDFAPAHAWRGEALRLRAEHAMAAGWNPEPDLAAATAAFKRALAINPDEDKALLFQGRLNLLRAEWDRRHGRQWHTAFSAAVEAFGKAQQGASAEEARLALARAHHQHAVWRLDAGLDPTSSVAQGLELTDEILRDRELGEALAIRAGLLSVRAQTNAPEATAAASQAATDLRRALALNRNLTPQWADLSQKR